MPRAESVVVDLMGLREAQTTVLGRAKYSGLVTAMTPTYERWANEWLKFGSVATWFARFLATESGQVLLERGTKQVAVVVPSIQRRDWHYPRAGCGAYRSDCRVLETTAERNRTLPNALSRDAFDTG